MPAYNVRLELEYVVVAADKKSAQEMVARSWMYAFPLKIVMFVRCITGLPVTMRTAWWNRMMVVIGRCGKRGI